MGGGGGGTFSIMINLAEIGHHIFRCGQHYRNQEMLVWWGDLGGSRYTKKGGVYMYRTHIVNPILHKWIKFNTQSLVYSME